MNDTSNSNVFSTGGGGHVFENSVQTAFVITMMVDGNIPGIPQGKIEDIRLQAKSSTDDLVVRICSNKFEQKLFAQIKHNLTFSSTNETFLEVLKAFWNDYNDSSLFNPETDKLAFIVGGLNSKQRNHIKPILNWSNSKRTFAEYQIELQSSQLKLAEFKTFYDGLNSIADDGVSITEAEVWEFLKVVELFDYDFVNEHSVDKAYFLNLIEAYNNSTSKPIEIWGSIYEHISKKNAEGATLTSKELEKSFNYFGNKSPQSKDSLNKLLDESSLLIDRISDRIGDFHLNRVAFTGELKSGILLNNVTIISGQAGIGKSAFSKEILSELKDHFVLSFVADQFNRPRLSESFSNLGITQNLIQVVSHYSLYSEKLIYIDSFEKLLEGEADAFRELLILIKKYRIKLIVSCRDYAVEALTFKFDLNISKDSIIEVPVLEDTELESISQHLPELEQILRNENLKNLLNRPKYLDFAFRLAKRTSENLVTVDELVFKQKLWDHIVKNINVQKEGIHEKREASFIELAVNRAKHMTLYTDVSGLDITTVNTLYNDGIISKSDDLYAPSHDILEDWALIRHIWNIRIRNSDDTEFFANLSTEPAIRRAFRLWLEELLLKGGSKAYEFIRNSILSNSLARHWKDEVTIAILKSTLARDFFEENSTSLLANDFELLSKFVHLLRVACKDSRQVPKGPGWEVVIEFIYSRIELLTAIYPLVLGLFVDWRLKIYYNRAQQLPPESQSAGLSILKILDRSKSDYSSWGNRKFRDDQIENAIELLFHLASVIKNEVEQLLIDASSRILSPREEESDYRTRDYCEKIVEYSISGLHSGALPQVFPDLLTSVANDHWKEDKKPKEDWFGRRDEVESYFGLTHKFKRDYFPASSYQTFVNKLLWYHPIKAFDFIIDLVSYSSKKYEDSDFAKSDVVKLALKFDDKEISQTGSYVLWQMFRGTGTVTPYLLQSVLMSLERYLFELGQSGSEVATKNLHFSFEYLILNSDSVAITSVLSSIAMAYPKQVGIKILFFLQCREFLDWDSGRWSSDQSHMLLNSPLKSRVDEYFFDEERQEAENWEHRKKYYRGLLGFISDFQLRDGSINKEIHESIDSLRKKSDPTDLQWRKMLTEMDTRQWKAEVVEGQPNIVAVQPEYKGDVKEMVDSFEEERVESNKAAGYWSKVKALYEGKEKELIEIEFWKECKDYFEATIENPQSKGLWSPIMFAVPGQLAYVGLKNLTLEDSDFEWVLNLVIRQCGIIVSKSDEFGGQIDFSVNLMDYDPLLDLLAYITKFKERIPDDKYLEVKTLIMVICLKMHNNHHQKSLFNSIRLNLWKYDLPFATSLVFGTMRYAEFSKKYGHKRHYSDDKEELKEIEERERVIFDEILTHEYKISNTKLSFDYETHSPHYVHVINQIIAIDADLDFVKEYLLNSFKTHLDAVKRENKGYNTTSYLDTGHSLEKTISEFLLANPNQSIVCELFIELVKLSLDNSVNDHYQLEFIDSFFEQVYLALDQKMGPEDDQEISNRFWNLWQILFELINENKSARLSGQFLLHCKYWKAEATDWKPLEQGKAFLEKSIPKLHKYNSNNLLELLSGIGFSTLMPQGITWLVKEIQEAKGKSKINFQRGEKLIKLAYQSNTKELKDNKQYLNDFMWLLDILIELGSSNAYLIRENLIVYKEH